jgi:hypothetical protein
MNDFEEWELELEQDTEQAWHIRLALLTIAARIGAARELGRLD